MARLFPPTTLRRLGWVRCGNCMKTGGPDDGIHQPERRFRIEQGLDRLMTFGRAWEFQSLAFQGQRAQASSPCVKLQRRSSTSRAARTVIDAPAR